MKNDSPEENRIGVTAAGFPHFLTLPGGGAEPVAGVLQTCFTLDRPRRVPICCTGMAGYQLILDGRLIHRGPEWSGRVLTADELDLELTAGEHTLTVLLWHFLKNAGYREMSPVAAFALRTVDDADDLHTQLSTGAADYRCKLLPGLESVGYHMSCMAAPRVQWDFRVPQGEWRPAPELPDSLCGAWSLCRRTLPAMRETRHRRFRFRGAVEALNEAFPAQADAAEEFWRGSAERLAAGERVEIGPRRTVRLLWDCEDYLCAFAEFRCRRGRDASVEVMLTESLFTESGDWESCYHHPVKGNRAETRGKFAVGTGDRVFCDGAEHMFRTLDWDAGRYLVLTVQTGDEPLVLEDFALFATGYPLTRESRPEWRDEALDTLTELCTRTLQCCMHTTYMDCPHYEQMMYAGDGRLEVLATYVLTRDRRLPRKALLEFAASQQPNGMTLARFPSREKQLIPGFALYFVAMLYDYALWNDEPELAARLLPQARRVLEAFLRCRNGRGPLIFNPAGWNFYDWAEQWDRGTPPGDPARPGALLNCHAAYTLAMLAHLEDYVGSREQAEAWRAEEAALLAAVRERFFVPERGLFSDDEEHRFFSQHTQAMALLCGLGGRDLYEAMFREEERLTRCTVYFSHYLFEAAKRFRDGRHPMELLKFWHALPDRGFLTVPERPEPSRSDCHGWGAHPLYYLVTGLAGIRPAEFGGKVLTVLPAEGIEPPECTVKLALPAGSVTVRCEAGAWRAECSGEVRLCGGASPASAVSSPFIRRKEPNMKKIFTAAVLLSCALSPLSGANGPVWDFSRPQSDWNGSRHLTGIQEKDAMVLHVQGPDSNIAAGALRIDPAKYPRIRITYSAEGFAGQTTGEIFFKGEKHPTWTSNYNFTLPSLISDGREHVLEVDARTDIISGANLWTDEKTITGLRLDLVNQSPGTIRLKKVELLGDDEPNKTSWDFRRKQPGWSNRRNLSARQESDGLHLNITGADSNIANPKLRIDPKKFSRVRIVYAASGFPQATSGEIFFAGAAHPAYQEGYCFRMPPLNCDGKEHTIELNARKDIAAGGRLWFDEGEIRMVRLDLVNEFPGEIILKSVEFLPDAPEPLTTLHEINVEKGFYFKAAERPPKVKLPAGSFQVYLHGLENPDAASAFCRAWPGFTPVKQPLKPGVWVRAGSLRLRQPTDLTLAPDQKMAVGVLLTPANTAVAARPDGVPETVPVTLQPAHAPQRYLVFDDNMPYWKSRMVAGTGLWYAAGSSLIRRAFTLDAKPEKAFLQITADDQVDELYLNGEKIHGLWTQDWKYPSLVEVTPYLRAGRNILGIRYTNSGNIGGVMYDLTCRMPGGNNLIVAGDGSERCLFSETAANWAAADFDDSSWRKVETRPGPPYQPWSSCILPYTDCRAVRGDLKATAQVPPPSFAGEPLKVVLTLRGTPELAEDEIVYAHIYPAKRNADSRPTSVASARLGELKPRKNADGSLEVTLSGFTFPEYGGVYDGMVDFGVFGRRSTGDNHLAFQLPERIHPSAPITVKNDAKSGRPTITLDGKPFYPVFLDVFYDRFPTGLTGKNSPVNVRTFLAGGTSVSQWWIGPGEYDFSLVDAKISKLIRDYPDACIAAWVWCQPPHWYDKLYPERISRESNGGIFPYYVATVTFSDPDYRRDMAQALTAFVEHCEKYFGGKMFAYNLCGGISLEWQGWGCHSQGERKVLNDYSAAARRDFVNFASERRPDLKFADVPSYEARTVARRTLFRDPVGDAGAITFDHYYSESIADCIAAGARAVKEACRGNKLVGAYYGYFWEYGNMSYCLNGGGHNAVNRLLKSPDIDFLLSPPSYGVRSPGEPGADMKVFSSIMSAGKFSMIEDDSRTHLTPPDDHNQTLNAEQTANILRRNWGMELARRTPLCLLTITDGREFSSAAVREDLAKVRAAGQKLFESDRESGVEIAVVVDEHSLRRLRASTQTDPDARLYTHWYGHHGRRLTRELSPQHITGELTFYQRIPLSRVGAGVDMLYLDDVPKWKDRYKFWIFLGNFTDSPELREALSVLRERPVTLLVAYGAGFATATRDVDAERMSELLGMSLAEVKPGPLHTKITDLTAPGCAALRQLEIGGGAPVTPRFAVTDPDAAVLGHYADGGGAALAEKKVGAMRLVFYGGVRLTPDLLRMLAAQAGVFIHSDSDDNYFAGYGIHTIHAVRAGEKTLRFAAPVTVKDLFSGEILGHDLTELTFPMKAHETRVLEVE